MRYRRIKFSKNWTKLNAPVFTTIRSTRNVKFKNAPLGSNWIVTTPTRSFPAVLLYNTTLPLASLSDELLAYDTDTESREAAMVEIQSFYKIPITLAQLMLFKTRNENE